MKVGSIEKKIILFLHGKVRQGFKKIIRSIENIEKYSRNTYDSYKRAIKSLIQKGLIEFHDYPPPPKSYSEYVLTVLGIQYYNSIVKQLTNEYQSITSLLKLIDI